MQASAKASQIPKAFFLKKKDRLSISKATALQKRLLRKQIFLLPSIQFLNTSKQQLN